MVFDILNTLIALSCPVRFQIQADIESFAFLFFLASVEDGPRKPPLKFGQNRVSNN